MTDMAIGEKYAPLGNWLKEHGGDSVKLTFNELNQIIPIRMLRAHIAALVGDAMSWIPLV